MKFDAPLLAPNLADVPARARLLQEIGYDGTFTFEGPHEPFMPLVLAAEHAPKLDVATGLAIAFARTPMTVANLAWDLQRYSEGRFILGLGSQIKPHVERRYGMPWKKPVTRMREFVRALRAIFDSFQHGTPLKFEGELYQHTLLPPFFNPGPNEHGAPPIFLGGVGTKMVEVAGEVADGLLVHPLNTPRFLDTVTLPAIARGRGKGGRGDADFTLACQVMIITGETEEEMQAATLATRGQIAFYGSTPAYKVVLDAEGWGDLQPELQQMTRENRWAEMPARIDDTMLHTIAIVGTPEEVAERLHARFGAIAGRIAIASPYPLNPNCERRIVEAYRALEGASA